MYVWITVIIATKIDSDDFDRDGRIWIGTKRDDMLQLAFKHSGYNMSVFPRFKEMFVPHTICKVQLDGHYYYYRRQKVHIL